MYISYVLPRYAMTTFCYTWNTADFKWNDNPYTWNDVCFALDLAVKLFGGVEDLARWPKKKKREFIKLYCKVKTQNEPPLLYDWRPLEMSQQYDLSEAVITAGNIKLVIERVLNITVEM